MEGEGKKREEETDTWKKGGGIGKQAAISMCLILLKTWIRAQMTQPSQRNPLSSLLCNQEVWGDPRQPASVSCLHSQMAKQHLTICNHLSLGRGRRGVSVSEPQSHLLSDKQTSPQPLPTSPSQKLSSISITSGISWWQAGVWWVEQSDVVAGKRHEDRIMTEWYCNNHHHGPHLHKSFNCQDNKISKSTCL